MARKSVEVPFDESFLILKDSGSDDEEQELKTSINVEKIKFSQPVSIDGEVQPLTDDTLCNSYNAQKDLANGDSEEESGDFGDFEIITDEDYKDIPAISNGLNSIEAKYNDTSSGPYQSSRQQPMSNDKHSNGREESTLNQKHHSSELDQDRNPDQSDTDAAIHNDDNTIQCKMDDKDVNEEENETCGNIDIRDKGVDDTPPLDFGRAAKSDGCEYVQDTNAISPIIEQSNMMECSEHSKMETNRNETVNSKNTIDKENKEGQKLPMYSKASLDECNACCSYTESDGKKVKEAIPDKNITNVDAEKEETFGTIDKGVDDIAKIAKHENNKTGESEKDRSENKLSFEFDKTRPSQSNMQVTELKADQYRHDRHGACKYQMIVDKSRCNVAVSPENSGCGDPSIVSTSKISNLEHKITDLDKPLPFGNKVPVLHTSLEKGDITADVSDGRPDARMVAPQTQGSDKEKERLDPFNRSSSAISGVTGSLMTNTDANTNERECSKHLDTTSSGRELAAELSKTDGLKGEKCKDKLEIAEDIRISNPPSLRTQSAQNDNLKKSMTVESDFGQVKLIKVSKFYIISVNGKKSKLPKNINQDTSLRLEKTGVDVMILTETLCFRIRMENEQLHLEDISRTFFGRCTRPAQPSDTKDLDNLTNDCKTDQQQTKPGGFKDESETMKSDSIENESHINAKSTTDLKNKETPDFKSKEEPQVPVPTICHDHIRHDDDLTSEVKQNKLADLEKDADVEHKSQEEVQSSLSQRESDTSDPNEFKINENTANTNISGYDHDQNTDVIHANVHGETQTDLDDKDIKVQTDKKMAAIPLPDENSTEAKYMHRETGEEDELLRLNRPTGVNESDGRKSPQLEQQRHLPDKRKYEEPLESEKKGTTERFPPRVIEGQLYDKDERINENPSSVRLEKDRRGQTVDTDKDTNFTCDLLLHFKREVNIETLGQKTLKMTFSMEHYMRWMFFVNSPVRRLDLSKLFINHITIEVALSQDGCVIITPLKGTMQLNIVSHHLKDEVKRLTKDIIVKDVSAEPEDFERFNKMASSHVKNKEIYIEMIGHLTVCAYHPSSENTVKTMISSLTAAKGEMTTCHIEKASPRKVRYQIALPDNLPWKTLFDRLCLVNKLKQMFPDLHFQIEESTYGVHVHVDGLDKDASKAKQYIKEDFPNTVHKQELQLSLSHIEVFVETDLCNMIQETIGDEVCIILESNQPVLYSLDEIFLRNAITLIGNKLVYEKEEQLICSWRGEDAVSFLNQKYTTSHDGVLVHIDKQRVKVIVSGWKASVMEIIGELKELQKRPFAQHTQGTKKVMEKEIKKVVRRSLEHGDVWSLLFERFGIVKIMTENVKKMSQDILITTELRLNDSGQTVLILSIEGSKRNAESLMDAFVNDYENTLESRKVSLPNKLKNCLSQTHIEQYLKRRFPGVLATHQGDALILYAFQKEKCFRIADEIEKRKYFEDRVLLFGEWREDKAGRYLIDTFKDASTGVVLTYDKDALAIKVAGFNDEVKSLTGQIAVFMQNSKTSRSIKIDDDEKFTFLQLDARFIDQLKDKYGVTIVPMQSEQHQGFTIKGISSNIASCQQDIEKYLSNIISQSLEYDVETLASVFTKDFETTMNGIQAKHNVIVKSSLNLQSGLVYKQEHKSKKEWMFPSGQKVILLNQEQVPVDAFYIVEVNETSDIRGASKRHQRNGKSMISLSQPRRQVGRSNEAAAVSRTKELIRTILKDADDDKEEAIIFKIPRLQTWGFESLMNCWMAVFAESFMCVDNKGHLKFILLCGTATEFNECLHSFRTGVVDFIATQSRVSRESTDALAITVTKGKLNETEADILVNTASPNLDLTKGAVSHSLLQTAGKELQTEITKRHPRGIKPSEIAITNGHRLRCRNVYHGALQPYDRTSHRQIVREFHTFMRACLATANTQGAMTIAFPAIGTGNLRYPLQLVVDEMYQAVNQFKSDCPDTSIVEVLFVVFDGDKIACEAFMKKQEIEDQRRTHSSKSLASRRPVQPSSTGHFKITVKGHRAKTESAMEMIRRHLNLDKQSKSNTDTQKLMTYSDVVKEQPTASKSVASVTEELSVPHNIRHAFRCDTRERLVIRVYEADICQLPAVDCIVNPANNRLEHHGGLAATIADAAGEDLVKESKAYILKHGSLATGDAIRTTPGKLYYDCIIHAVGPNWMDYRPHSLDNVMACQTDLRKAILSSLEVAERNGMSTIAIPAISSAIFGVPREICVMEYAKAVIEFSSRKQSHTRCLKEVHFVDLDNIMVGLIKQGFTEMLINQNLSPWNWKIYVDKEPTNMNVSEEDTFSTIPCVMDSGHSMTCKLTQTCFVTISGEDIFSFKKLHAIVCSEDLTGTATGGVAKSLLKKGGRQYEIEKTQKFKMNKQKTGNVIVTGGGNTGYNAIIHAIMPHRSHFGKDEGKWTQALADMIDTIFDAAKTRGYETMVMSLLGTGAGNSDPRQCAKILYDRLTIACTRYPESPFFLHIVNNNADRTRIVCEVFKDQINQSKTLLSQASNRTAANSQRMGPTMPTSGDRKTNTGTEAKQPRYENRCAICLEGVKLPKTLQCGHDFCTGCIDRYFKEKPVCPTCGTVCGVLQGNQPDGDMTIEKVSSQLPGYHCETIKITYAINGGTQGKSHPSPGKPFKPIVRVAYLPYTKEGREVCGLLKLAFERRLVFTIGVSRTTGEDGVITWNDIHHKTNPNPGAEFGYPDPAYFDRVKEELAVKGVKVTDPEYNKVSIKKKLDDNIRMVIPVKVHRSAGIFESTV